MGTCKKSYISEGEAPKKTLNFLCYRAKARIKKKVRQFMEQNEDISHIGLELIKRKSQSGSFKTSQFDHIDPNCPFSVTRL